VLIISLFIENGNSLIKLYVSACQISVI